MAQRNPHRVDLGNALARFMGNMESVDLDRAMGWTSSKTSRLVDGTKTLTEIEVDRLAHVLRLIPEQEEELRRLAELARKRKAQPYVADYATSYVAFEQDAVKIDAYSDQLVPGIGQCAVYAAAVLATANPNNVAERAAARLDRQKILTVEEPPRVRLLLGEAVLHKRVGGAAGLRQQLEHLLSQAELGRIQLAIDRYTSGPNQCMGSRFNIVTRATGDARVYIESALTSTYLHEKADVEEHQRIFDDLWGQAAKGESATILRTRIQQLA